MCVMQCTQHHQAVVRVQAQDRPLQRTHQRRRVSHPTAPWSCVLICRPSMLTPPLASSCCSFGVGWYDSPSTPPPTPPSSEDDDDEHDPTACSGCSEKRRRRRDQELESELQERSRPCIFNSVVPVSDMSCDPAANLSFLRPCLTLYLFWTALGQAWNNENLSRLAEKIRSPLIL